MRVLQIVLMGAAFGIVCGVFTLMVELGVLMMRVSSAMAETQGGLSAASATTWAPVATIVGFCLGALWQYRRSS